MPTMLDSKLSQRELREAILSFAEKHDTAALGTTGPAGVRVSPVKYFLADDLNVYIPSRGGSKFDNLAVNSQVCLLVAEPFQDNCEQIKGIQLFGTAQVFSEETEEYTIATNLCPWDYPSKAKLIRVFLERGVYVDRLKGEDIKQEWRR